MSQPSVDHVDDAELIERSLEVREAFAGLYDRHAAAIFRFAARRLGEQVAEDVIAETFLIAFRRQDRYDLSQRDARPWLYGIALKVIGKERRAEGRMLRALALCDAAPGRMSRGGEGAANYSEPRRPGASAE